MTALLEDLTNLSSPKKKGPKPVSAGGALRLSIAVSATALNSNGGGTYAQDKDLPAKRGRLSGSIPVQDFRLVAQHLF